VSFSLIQAGGWTHRHGDAKRRFSLLCEREIKWTKEEKRVIFDWFLSSGYNEFLSVIYISQIRTIFEDRKFKQWDFEVCVTDRGDVT
jgi:hypothetical protein